MSLLLLLVGGAAVDQSTAWEFRPSLSVTADHGRVSVSEAIPTLSVASDRASASASSSPSPAMSVSEQRPN